MKLKTKSTAFLHFVKEMDDLLSSMPSTTLDGEDIRNTSEIGKYVNQIKDFGIDIANRFVDSELEGRDNEIP
tara:strand:- start:433 stop:648 length:216 start_codon:yes stop_codon:yes gene_type:complete